MPVCYDPGAKNGTTILVKVCETVWLGRSLICMFIHYGEGYNIHVCVILLRGNQKPYNFCEW